VSEDSECIHGMEYGCSICSGKDVRRRESEGIEYSYRAKYEGQCPGCDLPIVVGQQCVKTTRGRNLHADCLP
jgi:hypothetical protein